jgi:hypothetical protein
MGLMFQDDRGWAGSFAVREISDRSVYDGGPNVNNLGPCLVGRSSLFGTVVFNLS